MNSQIVGFFSELEATIAFDGGGSISGVKLLTDEDALKESSRPGNRAVFFTDRSMLSQVPQDGDTLTLTTGGGGDFLIRGVEYDEGSGVTITAHRRS